MQIFPSIESIDGKIWEIMVWIFSSSIDLFYKKNHQQFVSNFRLKKKNLAQIIQVNFPLDKKSWYQLLCIKYEGQKLFWNQYAIDFQNNFGRIPPDILAISRLPIAGNTYRCDESTAKTKNLDVLHLTLKTNSPTHHSFTRKLSLQQHGADVSPGQLPRAGLLSGSH